MFICQIQDVRFATHALTSLSGSMLPSSAEKGSGIRIEYAKNRMGEVSNVQHPQPFLAVAAAAASGFAPALGAADQQMFVELATTTSCLSPPPNKMVRSW
jgi:hypothetical protein